MEQRWGTHRDWQLAGTGGRRRKGRKRRLQKVLGLGCIQWEGRVCQGVLEGGGEAEGRV